MKNGEFKLTNLSVANKTTLYIFTVVLVIFGFMQYDVTPKERFPEIVFPYFMVSTVHPGTSPADMENLITRPIEKHLKGIDGIKHINSNSIQDFSSIFIEFELTADEMQAYLDVRQAVDDARDVRVVAVQRVGELAHRDRPVGVEDAERADLWGREVELGRDGEEAATGGVEQLVHERPGLAGRRRPAARRARGCHRATYGTYTDKSLTTSSGSAARVS